jgi:hypothetical protein
LRPSCQSELQPVGMGTSPLEIAALLQIAPLLFAQG